MIPINNRIQVTPVNQGLIQEARGATYLVHSVAVSADSFVNQGDTIIVEPERVIAVMVNGEETFFVENDDILAVIPKNEQ
jgi:co-chaperonin GroES (HSP10)